MGWRRGRWVVAAGAAVCVVVAVVIILGLRYGWWSRPAGSSPRDPAGTWDWIERVSWIAGALGLPVALAFGLQAWREDRSARRGDPEPAQRRWRLVPVQECRPEQVGVHPAGTTPESHRSGAELPAYVLRDHDAELRRRLLSAARHGGLVVLVGGSSTGKSRSLFEAIREVCPDWRILLADTAAAVREASAVVPARTVVWLDDTPAVRYFGDGGLTRTDVLNLIDRADPAGPIVVVDMLWPGPARQLRHKPQDLQPDENTADLWRDAREALSLAQEPVRVPEQFTPAERGRVAETIAGTADRRLVNALADKRFGVTQHLAGVPQVIDHWEHGAQANPYGWAVLTTAIDIRRVGVRAPMTAKMFTALAAEHLTAEQRAEAPSSWLDDALSYATAPLPGRVRALHPLPGATVGLLSGYELADYLQQYGGHRRYYTAVPESFWTALPAVLPDPDDVVRLADSALERGRHQDAERLYRLVLPTSLQARHRLADLLLARGQERALRDLTEAGDAVARSRLAQLLTEAKKPDEAIIHWRILASAPDPQGETDRDAAGYHLVRLLSLRGQEEELRRRADAGDRYAARRLGERLLSSDRTAELRSRADAGDFVSRWGVAELLEAEGRSAEAMHYWQLIREDPEVTWRFVEVLARTGRQDHLRRLADLGDHSARRWLSWLLAGNGRREELRQRAAAGDRSARYWHARLLWEDGNADRLRALSTTGDKTAARFLVHLLVADDRIDQLRELAAGGDAAAQRSLAERFAERGQIRDLEEAAAAGNEAAREKLPALLEREGRVDEAVRLLVRSRADGSSSAARQLPKMLARHGRADELWDIAGTGDPHAGEALAGLLTADRDEERMRHLASAGVETAQEKLVKLFLGQGRAMDLCRLAVECGHPVRTRLAQELMTRGQDDLLRDLALAGIGEAREYLSKLLGKLGDWPRLERMAAAGDRFASTELWYRPRAAPPTLVRRAREADPESAPRWRTAAAFFGGVAQARTE